MLRLATFLEHLELRPCGAEEGFYLEPGELRRTGRGRPAARTVVRLLTRWPVLATALFNILARAAGH